jgi:hypothetical protein
MQVVFETTGKKPLHLITKLTYKNLAKNSFTTVAAHAHVSLSTTTTTTTTTKDV